MVNYRYDLSNIDENHQMYFDEKKLNCSKSILLMKKQYQDKKNYLIFPNRTSLL